MLLAPPVAHQAQVWDLLLKRPFRRAQSPYWLWETEAAILPFLAAAAELPRRMIYVLPLRSLARELTSRIGGYAGKIRAGQDFTVRVQHGERPESVLFAADAVVGTIDKVVSSYACAPLTLPARHGNIHAGAEASSFLVFDETHLVDSQLGLQAARLICERLQRMGLPFVIMTATLPDKLVQALTEEMDVKPYDQSTSLLIAV